MKDCIIKDDKYCYFTLEVRSGRALLDVTCGGVCWYSVRFYLNDEELEQFEEEGMAYLRDLAYRVCKHESEFAHRFVPPPPPAPSRLRGWWGRWRNTLTELAARLRR